MYLVACRLLLESNATSQWKIYYFVFLFHFSWFSFHGTISVLSHHFLILFSSSNCFKFHILPLRKAIRISAWKAAYPTEISNRVTFQHFVVGKIYPFFSLAHCFCIVYLTQPHNSEFAKQSFRKEKNSFAKQKNVFCTKLH